MENLSGVGSKTATVQLLMSCGAMLPEAARNYMAAKVTEIANPAEAGAHTIETLYAIRGEEGFGDDCAKLMGDLAQTFEQFDFFHFGEGRGMAIKAVADRILAGGEAVAEGDPDIDTRYCPQEFHSNQAAAADPEPAPEPEDEGDLA